MYSYNLNTRARSPTPFINGEDTDARRGSPFNKVGNINRRFLTTALVFLWADMTTYTGRSAKNMTKSS